MYELALTATDRDWIHAHYPDLAERNDGGLTFVEGTLRFNKTYQGKIIEDSYEIRIELQPNQQSDLPTVYELGSRLIGISEQSSTPLADLHAYENESVCLCVKPAEASYFPNGFSFKDFMEKLVVPYFYALSFFEMENQWPWETHSHGMIGWLEWFYEHPALSDSERRSFVKQLVTSGYWRVLRPELLNVKMVSIRDGCICGSGSEFRVCHPNLFVALWRLQNDLRMLCA